MKIRSLQLVRTVLDREDFPKPGPPEIAVSGRSNVGKSSILNMLFTRRNLARVSREPGKTRTFNFYLVNERFYLVDLPGYGFARTSKEEREKWLAVIVDYFERRRGLGGVIQLVDSRHDPMPHDIEMIRRILASGRRGLVVLTKADKLKRSQRAKAAAALRGSVPDLAAGPFEGAGGAAPPGLPFLFASAVTGEGKDAIWRWISDLI